MWPRGRPCRHLCQWTGTPRVGGWTTCWPWWPWACGLPWPCRSAAGRRLRCSWPPWPWGPCWRTWGCTALGGALEVMIAASVVLLGALLVSGAALPAGLGLGLVGASALLHGTAHGLEMAAGASFLAYGAGFVLATAALHLGGMGLGVLLQRVPCCRARRSPDRRRGPGIAAGPHLSALAAHGPTPQEARMNPRPPEPGRHHRHRRTCRGECAAGALGLCVRGAGARVALDQRIGHHRAVRHRLPHRSPCPA